MSENDYIAEFVRERHPHILGVDYALWKVGKMTENAMQRIADTLFQIDWSRVGQSEDEAESQDKEEKYV